MVFGTASLIPQADLDRKVAALTSITNHAFKRVGGDRWNDCRMATDAEIKSTRVIEVQIELASAKVIVGGPDDEKSDLEDPKVRQGVWAGELVLKQGFAGIRQSGVGVTAAVPDYVKAVLAA